MRSLSSGCDANSHDVGQLGLVWGGYPAVVQIIVILVALLSSPLLWPLLFVGLFLLLFWVFAESVPKHRELAAERRRLGRAKCQCGCGKPLPPSVRNRKNLNPPHDECQCGCGAKLPPRRRWNRKYLNAEHRSNARGWRELHPNWQPADSSRRQPETAPLLNLSAKPIAGEGHYGRHLFD